MCNLHWCYTWTALLSANQTQEIFLYMYIINKNNNKIILLQVALSPTDDIQRDLHVVLNTLSNAEREREKKIHNWEWF